MSISGTGVQNRPVDSLHKGGISQSPGPGRAFKGLGVAKRYCRMDSIGDRFFQLISSTHFRSSMAISVR